MVVCCDLELEAPTTATSTTFTKFTKCLLCSRTISHHLFKYSDATPEHEVRAWIMSTNSKWDKTARLSRAPFFNQFELIEYRYSS